MARTKYVPPRSGSTSNTASITAKKLASPRTGVLTPRLPRFHSDQSATTAFPAKARQELITTVLPTWKNGMKRSRAFNGLCPRLNNEYRLRLGYEGVRRREVMGVEDSARIRKMRKVVGGCESRLRAVKERVLKRRAMLRVGGEGEKMWVVGGWTEGSSRLRVVEVAVEGGNEEMGDHEKIKATGILERERERIFWGGYQTVKKGL